MFYAKFFFNKNIFNILFASMMNLNPIKVTMKIPITGNYFILCVNFHPVALSSAVSIKAWGVWGPPPSFTLLYIFTVLYIFTCFKHTFNLHHLFLITNLDISLTMLYIFKADESWQQSGQSCSPHWSYQWSFQGTSEVRGREYSWVCLQDSPGKQTQHNTEGKAGKGCGSPDPFFFPFKGEEK